MTTVIIALTSQEVAEAQKQADKYYALIQKELSMGELVNIENVARYTKEYKIQMGLVNNPFIEMPKL